MHAKKREYIIRGFIGGNGIDTRVVSNEFFNTYDMSKYPIFDATVEKEVNKCGAFKFTMGATHPFIDAVKPYLNWVLVEQHAGYINTESSTPVWESLAKDVLFSGRVIEVDKDLYGNKTVTCEGVLGYFNDLSLRIKDIRSWSYNTRAIAYGATVLQDDIYKVGTGAPEAAVDARYKMIQAHNKNINVDPDYLDSVDIYEGEDDDLANDVSVVTLLDYIQQYSLNLVGGAYYIYDIYDHFGRLSPPINVNANNVLDDLYEYIGYVKASEIFGIGTGVGGMLLYDGESVYDSETRTYTLVGMDSDDFPRFVLGENIISISKEPALDKIYTGVFPIGKNGMVLSNNVPIDDDEDNYNYGSNYVWHTNSRNKYGSSVISLDYNNVTNKTTLRRLATNWINMHATDGLVNEYKYTITGPEPVVLGYGSYFIKPLYGVMFIENDSTSTSNAKVYPCLSMKVDISNPQNNQYTFGPFVSDNYTETTISRRAGNR